MENIEKILKEINGLRNVSVSEFFDLIVSVDKRLKQDRSLSLTFGEYPDRQD